MFESADLAARVAAAITGLYFLVTSTEFLSEPRTTVGSPLRDWRILSTSTRALTALEHFGVARALFSNRGWIAQCSVSFLAAVVLVFAALIAGDLPEDGRPLIRTALIILTFNQLLVLVRRPYGLDGSDQMGLVLTVALFGWFAFKQNSLASKAAIYFAAAQVTLAYFVSGAFKLASRQWRTGAALPAVLSTRAYGVPRVGLMLAKKPSLALLGAWVVILWELLFPIGVWAGGSVLLIFLGLGAVFHTVNFFLLRLNAFLWAFLATYPLLLAARHLV